MKCTTTPFFEVDCLKLFVNRLSARLSAIFIQRNTSGWLFCQMWWYIWCSEKVMTLRITVVRHETHDHTLSTSFLCIFWSMWFVVASVH